MPLKLKQIWRQKAGSSALDCSLFSKRLNVLVQSALFKPSAEQGAGDLSELISEPVDALLFTVGASQDSYSKSVSLQTWLFGYEFPDTVCLISRDRKLYCLSSAKKGRILEDLNNQRSADSFTVQAFKRSKDQAEITAANSEFLAVLEQFSTVGILPKDKFEGQFYTEFSALYADVKSKVKEIDASAAVAAVLAVKDPAEMELMQHAAHISSKLMSSYFAEEMASIIDQEKKVAHVKLSERIESGLFDERVRKKLQFPSDIEAELLDWCYTPIIQSGGVYDLKPSAQSNTDNLHGGTVLCSLGVRYRNYCTNVARTFMIDPSPAQEKNYLFLLQLQQSVLASLQPGVSCKQVWDHAVSVIRDKRPELESHFVKNIGFVTGLEFRESAFVLNGKNQRILGENMTVNLSLGFQDLENIDPEDEQNRIYALFICDTVVVGNDGGRVLTADSSTKFGEISFFLRDENASDSAAAGINNQKSSRSRDNAGGARSAILRTKLRAEARDEEMSAVQKRKQHQSQLLLQLQQEALQRFSGSEGPGNAPEKPQFRRYESYKKDTMLPREIRRNQLLVDRRNETILIPMFGFAVPMHINTLKNITKSEEGEFTYLRLNFNIPGQVAAKKDEALPYDDANAHFLRTLVFRSTATARYQELYKQITELKKEVQKKEQERREKADLVEQDRLMESKRPLAILTDVNIRPPLEGKKLPGDLQIHTNGVRYSSIRGDQRVDILFSNIKHLFFQPCDNELYAILHFHLKNPIMVGKKKTKDIQFVREATDASFDETSNRRRRQRYGDEDELMAEQEERKNRQRLNKEFKLFAEKLSEISDGKVEADLPIRELGFYGVPQRSNVLMQPTTECLVHLTELPATVITLADVEIAYLERVQFHLKNFDIVFVFKDLRRPPVHINSIPMKSIEPVREWLDSMDICFFETPVNLNWQAILKVILEDPAGFYEDGGWSTMQEPGEGEEDSDEEESASEYEASTEEEESSEDDFSDSEFDDEDETEEEEEEDESEGEDWDDLERKARREDERRHGGGSKRRDDSDEDERPRKKKK